jgi:PAS domain S-box-containing protein
MSSSGSEIWLAPLLNSAETALIGIDREGRVGYWSGGAELMFGWTADEVLGREPPIVPPTLREEWYLQMQRVFDTGMPSPTAETQRLARNGRTISVLRTSTPVRDTSGRVVGLTDLLIDATALKQLDEEARALVQVRERELIAMDLHDGLIQSLYAVVLNLAAQERSIGGDVSAIRAARLEVERAIAETRSHVFDFRGAIFSPRSLESGLQLFVDSLRLNAGIDVDLRVDPSVESLLEPDVRGHLLYVIREAVSNVLRHASASAVSIELSRLPEAVIASVTDDGRGFVPPGATEAVARYHGLHNMAERARLMGARLHITATPGRGTRVQVELPL